MPIKSMEDKYTQSANESRAIDKANGRKNGARNDVRQTGLRQKALACSKHLFEGENIYLIH